MASPPTRWLKLMNRSAANVRSANWLLKNIPTIAANGNALRISDCSEKNQAMLSGKSVSNGFGGWVAENPRLGRYPKIKGSHAPQMKNSSTIITISLICVFDVDAAAGGFMMGPL